MIGTQDIGRYDRRGDLERATVDNTDGMSTTTWSTQYSDVAAREIRAKGSEKYEEGQLTNTTIRAWAIRKHDRTITTKDRWLIDGEYFYLTDVHPNPKNRSELIIEGMSRNND